MELSPCRSESVSEIYFDALENVQQVNSQNVESSQFSQIDKDVLVRTSINQKSTSSSSYYTADEPMDDKDRATSGNLFGKNRSKVSNCIQSFSLLSLNNNFFVPSR
ncbi:unnamed protein product [Trichobilharzia regenti]|nr:unnamed protein product [Trichobilharzia regenti]